MIGSVMKCGLPSACTSPAARVTFAGTFIRRTPCDACDAPRFADFDLRIARVLQERRQPANLQFRAAFDQDIGVAQLHDKARPRVDEVRVFGRFRHRCDFDFVAADFARERARNRAEWRRR